MCIGQGKTLETMEAIRAKQERLARLHFDLGSSKVNYLFYFINIFLTQNSGKNQDIITKVFLS